MCGLAYYHNKDIQSSLRAILKRYEAQRERGVEGFGFVSFDLDTLKLIAYKRQAGEKEMKEQIEELKDMKDKSNGLLFHHRKPTSTPNLAECAHPICVMNNELEDIYFVAHNGIISNCDYLKEIHEHLGYKYNTEVTYDGQYTIGEKVYKCQPTTEFNDSESLAIELARVIEGKQDTMDAKGSIAFIVLRCHANGFAKSLYFGRNYQNPLYIDHSKNGAVSLTSEKFGTGEAVESHKLFCYDFISGTVTSKDCDIGYKQPEYSGHYREKWQGGKSDDKVTYLGGGRHDDEEYESTEIGKMVNSYGAVRAEWSSAYFNDPSQLDYTIDELLGQGSSIEDLIDFTLEEIFDIEAIIEYEKVEPQSDKNRANLPKLTDRLKQLNARLQNLEIRQNVELVRSEKQGGLFSHEESNPIGYNLRQIQ